MGQIEAHVFLFCRSINAFQFDLYSMSAIFSGGCVFRAFLLFLFSKKAKKMRKKKQIKL